MTRVKRASLGLMGAFYVFAGAMHFAKPENYLRIMPPYLPAHLTLVLVSGAAEIVLGVAVLFTRTRRLAAWGLIVLLVAVFPANLYMYRHALETSGSAYDVDPRVLYARLWLQLFFIVWAAWYIRPEKKKAYPL